MSDLAKLEATARGIAAAIGETIRDEHGRDQVGFMLMMFEFRAGGWSTYLSNAERQSMIKAMEELIQRLRETA